MSPFQIPPAIKAHPGKIPGNTFFPNRWILALSLSSSSPANFWSCTDKIVSIEWRDLVPRQRASDCFRDSLPSLSTLWSAVIKSPNFSAHCVFCKEPSSFWFSSMCRNFGLLGSEKNYCASVFVSTFEASPSESEISLSEECAGTYVSRSSRLSGKGGNQSGMPCVGSSSFISSSLCAEPRFPEPASVFRMHAWHFESLLDLMMFRIHRKNWTDPLVSMWKPSCCWKMITILVQQEVQCCPFF